MKINYLVVIWDVKIFLAKIKDCKGKDLNYSDKKKLPTKIPPKSRQMPLSSPASGPKLEQKHPMKWKEILVDYLSFTRKERIGILTILLIILLAIFLPLFFSSSDPGGTLTADTAWVSALQKLEAVDSTREKNKLTPDEGLGFPAPFDHSPPASQHQSILFYFDPNTLSPEEWKQLGLSGKTIQIIQNYLRKGGRFKKAEDLQRVYGLRRKDYERIAPYVRIVNSAPARSWETADKGFPLKARYAENKNSKAAGLHSSSFLPVDINKADTIAFINLPGIGNRLASRIVNFRERLGGFFSIEQVKETFGLPDSTYQKIRPLLQLENPSVKTMNINTATIDELKTHPYIRYKIASSIIRYRTEHGPFATTEDLKKIMAITEDIYRKLSPYITTQ